jgi:hypothetical protein
MEKISWIDHVRNEVYHVVKEERNILQIIKRRKIKWIGQVLRMNHLLKYVIERMIEERREVTGSRGRRSNKLLDDLQEKRGYWKLKDVTRSYAM